MISLVSPENMRVLCEVAANAPRGAFVEVGVYQGGTALMLSRVAEDQALYLYDTFEGLPFSDPVDGLPAFEFADTSEASIRELIPRAQVIKGVFPDSLIPMEPVSFVHADCDQYRSVKAVIETMPPLMVDGGIIYFDDYGSLDGATKAVEEHGHFQVLANGKAIMRIEHGMA